MLAAQNRHVDVAKLLLEAGIKPDVQNNDVSLQYASSPYGDIEHERVLALITHEVQLRPPLLV